MFNSADYVHSRYDKLHTVDSTGRRNTHRSEQSFAYSSRVSVLPGNDTKRRSALAKHPLDVVRKFVWVLVRCEVPAVFML